MNIEVGGVKWGRDWERGGEFGMMWVVRIDKRYFVVGEMEFLFELL